MHAGIIIKGAVSLIPSDTACKDGAIPISVPGHKIKNIQFSKLKTLI